MLSLTVAQQLKAAGLKWTPKLHDFFAVPNRGLDERVFVIGDVLTYVEVVRGQLSVTFHGAVEWALDYVAVEEIVWLLRAPEIRTFASESPAFLLLMLIVAFSFVIMLFSSGASFSASSSS